MQTTSKERASMDGKLSVKLNFYTGILNIRNWEIELIEESALPVSGSCTMMYNDYKAKIKIQSELNDAEKEKTLIHELLHIVHRDSNNLASENLDEFKSDMYSMFHERAIEHMAKSIYKLIQVNY